MMNREGYPPIAERLEQHVEDCERVKQDLLEEFGRYTDDDWSKIYDRMADEEEYTPIPLGDDLRCHFEDAEIDEDGKDAVDKLHDSTFSTQYWAAMGKEKDIISALTALMRAKWETRDPDDRPDLVCSRCDNFSIKVASVRKHTCARITRCKECGHESSTHERHKAHMRAKHFKQWDFVCETCKFGTNSSALFTVHTKSKAHLQAIGAPKTTSFECALCQKHYRYKCEYERHLYSRLHLHQSNSSKHDVEKDTIE